jgi:hypothetical protein
MRIRLVGEIAKSLPAAEYVSSRREYQQSEEKGGLVAASFRPSPRPAATPYMGRPAGSGWVSGAPPVPAWRFWLPVPAPERAMDRCLSARNRAESPSFRQEGMWP